MTPSSADTSHETPLSVLTTSVSWKRDLLILTLFFGLLLAFRLGSYELGNPDEGRYAEIPREMVAANDYVTPRLDGVNYFEKPPFVYWCVAACLKLFGPSEWSMRVTPALFSLIGILATYAAARRIHGRNAGIAAAVVLGTSLLYFALSRILILDMVVSVLMSTALFCFILGIREPAGQKRRWLFYGLYASAALATLSKGLIGVLVPGAVMFFWLLLLNQWHRLRPFYLPTGALLFLAIAAPWHLLAAARNETWAEFYFIHEHWVRFTTTQHGRYQPIWFFIPIVLAGLIPWIGFLWQALKESVSGGWAKRKENADAWFFIGWAVFIFLFFSKSQSKLIPYILPVFPPLAVLIGAFLARRWNDATAETLKPGLRAFSFVCGLLGAALCFIMLKQGVVRMSPEQMHALRPIAFILAAILFAGGVIVPWLAARRGVKAALISMTATIVLFFGVLTVAAPSIQKPGTKELARIFKEKSTPADRVYHYHGFFHDFTFYSGQLVGLINYQDELELVNDAAARQSGRFITDAEFRIQWASPARLWVVARKRDTTELFADPTFQYHLIAESRDHYLISNQP